MGQLLLTALLVILAVVYAGVQLVRCLRGKSSGSCTHCPLSPEQKECGGCSRSLAVKKKSSIFAAPKKQ